MVCEGGSLSRIRSRVSAAAKNEEYPSMAVAVAHRGEIVWEEAFGRRDQEDRTEAIPDTIYPIASVSKSLAATGLMVLVEQKEVELDAPVEEYIAPSKLTVYEGRSSAVTVRRVLNMTSGVPHGYMVCENAHAAPNLKKFVEKYGIVVFPPGALELYSNFSYALIELIIETVAHTSFADFMMSEVFTPLGMRQTSVALPDGLEHVATKYNSEGTPVPHSYFVPAAAGGIYSSVHDLIQYGMFHLRSHLSGQRQILSDETLTAMHTAKDEGLRSAIMGLGWGSVTLDDGTVWVISNGGIEGATSMLSLVPDAHLAVACLTNITSPSRITDQVAVEITDVLLPKFSNQVEAFMERYELRSTLKPYRLTPELAGLWEGQVKAQESVTPIEMRFRDNGEISVRLDKHHGVVMTNARVGNGELRGDFRRMLGSGDRGSPTPCTISIHVRANRNRMYGVATESEDGSSILSPSYVSLHRV